MELTFTGNWRMHRVARVSLGCLGPLLERGDLRLRLNAFRFSRSFGGQLLRVGVDFRLTLLRLDPRL
ncbi:MAG TPA: hypothetical protein VN648_28050, partial [Candidatus Methylomirabilis sp.]|nr:hypothetical protein [Candidatus Methylomirabilis sp.]